MPETSQFVLFTLMKLKKMTQWDKSPKTKVFLILKPEDHEKLIRFLDEFMRKRKNS